MSLNEVLPAVRNLPRHDQVQLMHFLVEELARPGPQAPARESELLAQLAAAAPHQLDRPEASPEAVRALEDLLASHRTPPA